MKHPSAASLAIAITCWSRGKNVFCRYFV